MKAASKGRQTVRFVVGIDEVGRGPLAGPVAVGAVLVPVSNRTRVRRLFSGIRDSKKLSKKSREAWTKLILEAEADGIISCAVSFASPQSIDKKGITSAIFGLVARNLKKLGAAPGECEVLLDGSLRAPGKFARQKTIVRGDDTVMEISMASVLAKVLRDRKMARISRRFKGYGFDINKGYGTKDHIEYLRKAGPTPLHRLSFIRGIMAR